MSKEKLENIVSDDAVSVQEDKSTVVVDEAVTEEIVATEEVVVEAEETAAIDESFVSLFEDADLSEDFKTKASLVFEAAVSEAVSTKTAEKLQEMEDKIATIDEQIATATATLNEEFATKLSEAIEEQTTEISENVDTYVEYVVEKWVEDNALAIDSGIRLERAELFVEGVKSLFAEQNIEINEETVSVVDTLETELSEANDATNNALNENIALKAEIDALKASTVFEEVCESLTDTQKDRMKTLAEKLDNSDLEVYATDLGTLKETFFKETTLVVAEQMEEIVEKEEITENTTTVSDDETVNRLAGAISARANREK